MVVPSLVPGALLLSPSCHPGPLPGLTSEPTSQRPARASEAAVPRPVVQLVCAALTRLCCPQSSGCMLSRGLGGPTDSAHLCPGRRLPRRWVPFLLQGWLPLQSASPGPVPFLALFFFCSTQLCQDFLAVFGGLSSSASVQWMFCARPFTGWCVFLMCLWERARRLTPPPSCSASYLLKPDGGHWTFFGSHLMLIYNLFNIMNMWGMF